MAPPEDGPASLGMDAIVDLRNAMRQELGFSEAFPEDREGSWVIGISMKE